MKSSIPFKMSTPDIWIWKNIFKEGYRFFSAFPLAPTFCNNRNEGDAEGGVSRCSNRHGRLQTTFPRVFIAAYWRRARSPIHFSSSAMAEEPAAPEAKKSDTFQFPDGSKYGLHPPPPCQQPLSSYAYIIT